MSRIKVVNPNESWMGTEYYIDGKKINNVRSVDFRVAVDEVPCFAFETKHGMKPLLVWITRHRK